VNKFGKMEQDTLDNGKMINLMVTVFFMMMMEIYVYIEYNSQMMENGKIINYMERVSLLMFKEQYMKEIGIKANSMEEELKHIMINLSMKENLKMDKSKG